MADRDVTPTELEGHTRSVVEFALGSVLSPTLLVDGGGAIEAASPAALADLGEAPDLIRGRPITDVLGLTVADLATGAASLDATAAGAQTVRWRSHPLHGARFDGGWLVEFRIEDHHAQAPATVDDRAGDLEVLLTDLTDRHERLDRYLGLISHDLQAPTRRLLSFVELLRRELDDETLVASTSVDGIEKSAKYLLRFTTELLQFSRLGHEPIALQPVDANTALDAALEQLRGEIEAAGATIEVERPLPMVEASATFLTVVFQNIVQNSLSYRRDEPPEITISWTAADGAVAIAFADNGTGIDPKMVEAVFQPARRLVAPDQSHTGLGLATVRDVVERFGGSIDVANSEVGKGTTFVVRLRTPVA